MVHTVTGLVSSAWIRHRVTEGAKGPREYKFARVRAVEKGHHRPGPECWVMLRRPVGGGEVKFYLSNAPATMTLEEMAWTGCLRWTIERSRCGRRHAGTHPRSSAVLPRRSFGMSGNPLNRADRRGTIAFATWSADGSLQ